MKDFKQNCVNEKLTVKEALETLNDLSGEKSLTLFIVNDKKQLLGTLTDGDVRRGLINGLSLYQPVSDFMFKEFRYLRKNKFTVSDIDELRKKNLNLIPLLNAKNEIIRIIDLAQKRSIIPVDAFIMAGGEGLRLRPFTENLPKPLLKVGDKPIIEHNIDRLEAFGVNTVYISVNYLGEKIEQYLGNGKQKDIHIKYIKETKAMGTIGSMSLVDSFENDTILLMNSDLLTNIDFEDFYLSFEQKNADMAVASVPYKVNVPYAIFEVDDEKVLSLSEKPTYTYYSNAGIYLIKRNLLKLIPETGSFDATEFMQRVIENGHKLIYYPILGYWLDIGQHDEYKKAQEDIKHIKL
ncbi:MAG: nucleotidyltransferase family protein [Bacteroidetes bacterium]|nr:nucleotidyltransferase family protein [Bacteroidota bacterium]